MKFDPIYISKKGVHSYRFRTQIENSNMSKIFRFAYKPTQKQLAAEYHEWIKSIDMHAELSLPIPVELLSTWMKRKGEKYTEDHKYTLVKVKTFLIKYKNVSEIKKKDCITFFEKLKQGRKDTTAKRIYNVFSSFLSWCAMMDYIEYNPSLRLQFKVKQNKRMGVLNHEQKKEVLEKSKVFPHLHLAILIAMMTGLRQGEILSLQWTWIDFNHGTLRIPQENTKNKKGFYIALSIKLLEILKQEKVLRPSSSHVIEYYGNPIKDNVKHSFDRLRKHLSFQYLADGERFTFHHLRHTFATELAQSGLPLVEVKNALNHSDIQTTLRYAHSTGKGVVEAIDKINEDLI